MEEARRASGLVSHYHKQIIDAVGKTIMSWSLCTVLVLRENCGLYTILRLTIRNAIHIERIEVTLASFPHLIQS